MLSRIRSGERALGSEALGARAARAARGFRELGARDGAAVATLLRNDLPFFEVLRGARMAGAFLVPLNWHFHAKELAYVLEDAGTRVLVAHADLLGPIERWLPPGIHVLEVPTPPEIAEAYAVSPESCAPSTADRAWSEWRDAHAPLTQSMSPPGGTMLYTSGTTGVPKGVRRAPLTGEALEGYQRAIAAAFGLRAGMRAAMTGPLYHSAPFGYAIVGLALGCEILLMPRFEPLELLALIESERITHVHLVPTMFVRLLRVPEAQRRRYDLSSLECVTHGAAPCPVEIKRAMIEWLGPVLREYYGSTETSLVTGSSSAEWLARPGTVGRALPGARLAVKDDHGRVLAPGNVGEIWVHLDVMPAFTYHNREAERRAMERDGLLATGDAGYLDEAGYLYICDRKKDMIVSGGVNIYPAEIESVLVTHPRVRDCAVFGIPDEEFGELVACAIEPEAGAALSANLVRSFLARHVARYKLPSKIDFHDALPRLDNGKIYKRKLREPYWEGAGRRI